MRHSSDAGPLLAALLLTGCQLAPSASDPSLASQRLLQTDRDFAARADQAFSKLGY